MNEIIVILGEKIKYNTIKGNPTHLKNFFASYYVYLPLTQWVYDSPFESPSTAIIDCLQILVSSPKTLSLSVLSVTSGPSEAAGIIKLELNSCRGELGCLLVG